jgi:hypothetical protein
MEHSRKKRAYERRGKLKEFRDAVGLVVGDLLALTDKRPWRWLFRPMGREEFNDEAVSYRTFRAVFEALRALALIEVQPGYFDHAEGECQHGRCTRLRPAPGLLELARQHGIDRKEAGLHFRRLLPVKPLVLRAASTRDGPRKIQGRRMKIPPTKRSRELEAEVREVNEFIEEHDLRHGAHHGYRRIFNCGDAPDFAWDKGGRLYSPGDSYRQHNQAERLKMLIDGEPVVEVDIRASFLTILHALRGEPLNLSRDPYDFAGLPRSVVKAWITMTLGHHQFHTRWPKEIADEYLEKCGAKLGMAHPVRKVQEAVIDAFPVLTNWPEQKLTCFDLMYLESEAIIRAMLRLKRERGVVCLSVHDSIIVPAAQEAAAVAMLREEYWHVVGVGPTLKVNRPDGSVEIVSASARSAFEGHFGCRKTSAAIRLPEDLKKAA